MDGAEGVRLANVPDGAAERKRKDEESNMTRQECSGRPENSHSPSIGTTGNPHAREASASWTTRTGTSSRDSVDPSMDG